MANPNNPSSGAYNKLVKAAANAEGQTPEAYKKNLEERGAKTLQAVSITTEKDDIERHVKGLAIDAIEEWDKRRSEAALEKKAAKKGISVEQLQEQESKKSKVEKALSKIASLPGAILFSVPNSIKRSRTLRRYRNIAEQAINDNGGNLAAGAIAIEAAELNNFAKTGNKGQPGEYNEAVNQQVAEKLANGEGNDFAETLLGRASAAIEAGKDNEDTGVKVKSSELSFAQVREKSDKGEKLTSEEQKLKAIADFTAKVAGTSDEQAIRNARQKFLAQMSEISGGKSANNYAEIADKISSSLTGVLEKELFEDTNSKKTKKEREEKAQAHQDALQAIDQFLDNTVSVGEATVSTGLAAKETCANLKDNAVLKWGVVIGTGVSLGATFATAVSKSKFAQTVAGTNVAGLVVRTALAAGIGGIRAYRKEGQMQRRENVKRALNMEDDTDVLVEASKNKKGRENQFSILNAAKITQDMQELAEALDSGKDSMSSYQYNSAISAIAEIKLRNQLQNAKGIQLIGYSGRDNVEKQKLEMFKAINDLKKAMRKIDPERAEKLDDEINEQMQKHEFNKEFQEVEATQKGERWRAAGKGALIAGASALVVSSLMRATGIGAALAGVTDSAEADVAPGDAPDAPSGMPGSTLENSDFIEAPNIEALDANGDGIIDVTDFPDTDLTDDSQYEQLKELFEQNGINLEREEIDVSQYSETTVGNYLDNAENTVDNSGGVDWGRSATRVGFGTPTVAVGDGMDSYEVPVWGLNGQEVPDGAKLFIDFDGDNGPGQPLEFAIEDGKAIVPADVLDTSNAGSGGVANFIGTARVGEMDGNTMISYATAFGEKADLTTAISVASEDTGFAFTATDASGERISQFAVNSSNQPISNLSEIFNGVPVGDSDRLPFTFAVNDIDGATEATTLASGSTVPDLDYSGGYRPELDSFENTPFIEGKSYLGTPIQWDLDGDGVMNPEEEATYFKQLLVRTGTNPNMLGQNASNYGLLEPDRLESIIPRETLVSWGIEDGVVDSEAELNTLLDNLKLPENAQYYDSLVNNTINEMESQMQGGSFEVTTITDRISTFANSNRDFDTSRASIERTIIYPKDANGNPVGNTGWWCRKYGAEGGRVGDMPLCEQKGISPASNPAPATPRAQVTPNSEPVAPAPSSNPAPSTPASPTSVVPPADDSSTPVVPPADDSTTPDPVNPDPVNPDPVNPNPVEPNTPTPPEPDNPLAPKTDYDTLNGAGTILGETEQDGAGERIDVTGDGSTTALDNQGQINDADISTMDDIAVRDDSGNSLQDSQGRTYIQDNDNSPSGNKSAADVQDSINRGTQTTADENNVRYQASQSNNATTEVGQTIAPTQTQDMSDARTSQANTTEQSSSSIADEIARFNSQSQAAPQQPAQPAPAPQPAATQPAPTAAPVESAPAAAPTIETAETQ